MNKRRLIFHCSDDDYPFSDVDTWCEGDDEEVVLADALWPDQPHLNQLVTVDCGARGAFDVPLGCLDKEGWATAFTGTARTVSTPLCSVIVIGSDVPSLTPPAVRFDTVVECCSKNAFSGQQTQIELALDAVYSDKVSSKGELSELLAQHEEDAQDAAVEPDGDHPRLKVDDMDTEQHTAYLHRYVRRNASNPARTQAAIALIEYRQREVFSPALDFTIHRVDVVEPEFLYITQGGVSKRVKEDEVSGNPTSRPRWLRWKARTAKWMQELENKHSEKNPSVVE